MRINKNNDQLLKKKNGISVTYPAEIPFCVIFREIIILKLGF